MKNCYIIELPPTCAIVDLCDYYGLGMMITRINVPMKYRGKGYGSKLLRTVLDDADKENITLFLEILPSGALNYSELESWYKRYGFVEWNSIYRRITKMKKELLDIQIEAMKDSIEKWERIVAEKQEDNGIYDCACCDKFREEEETTWCENCPIKLYTDEPFCNDTPYYKWSNMFGHDDIRMVINDETKKAAIEELKFLKKVLKWINP